MKKNNLKGSLILLCGSLIWGLAFVVQTSAAGKIKPFALNGSRFLLGSFTVLIFMLIKSGITKEKVFKNKSATKKDYILGGTLCGVFLCLSANLQQTGISVYPENISSEARAGFLTALYVIIVPLIAVFIKKKIHPVIWLSVIAATVGVYLLCLKNGIGGIYLGDIFMLGCAVACSIHILLVDKYCSILGGTVLSAIQFFVCGIISTVLSLIFEPEMTVNNIISSAPQILYLGILSSGVAYTLQSVGQKYAEPAVASISMSFEGVFATLGGWLITGNGLSIREIFGCILVFIAIITAQFPEFSKKEV